MELQISSVPAARLYYLQHPDIWENREAGEHGREIIEAEAYRFEEAPEYHDEQSVEIGRRLVLGIPLPTVERNNWATHTVTRAPMALSEFYRLACIGAYRRKVLRVDGCCGRTPDENGNCPLLKCQCRRYAAAYFGGWGHG